MKTILRTLVVFLLCFLLGCIAYADKYEGSGYFDAADTRSAYDILDLLGNGWEFDHWVTTPTCTENGIVVLSYQGGGPEPFGVAAFGHDLSDWEPVIYCEPTCTYEGMRNYIRACFQTVVIPELMLNYRCHYTEESEYESIPRQCKFYVNGDGKTCLQDDPWCLGPAAYKIVKWPNCVLPGNKNAMQPVIDGEVAVVCAICGREDPDSEHLTGFLNLDEYNVEYVPLEPVDTDYVKNGPAVEFVPLDENAVDYATWKQLFHLWGDWTWKYQPTCTQDGYRVHYCYVCRRMEEEFIDAYNHVDPETGLSAWVPTWQERIDCEHYIQHYTCQLCGNTSFTTTCKDF